jgi:hypothetical protein
MKVICFHSTLMVVSQNWFQKWQGYEEKSIFLRSNSIGLYECGQEITTVLILKYCLVIKLLEFVVKERSVYVES